MVSGWWLVSLEQALSTGLRVDGAYELLSYRSSLRSVWLFSFGTHVPHPIRETLACNFTINMRHTLPRRSPLLIHHPLRDTPDYSLDVLIIGAGFAGCYVLHNLSVSNFRANILEADDRIRFSGRWLKEGR
jgi:hypothetical protein